MWILPNNYPLSSAFAAATGVSSEELALPDLNIESSLMWRSKPSAVKTWQRRWKTSSWMPRLYGRILKPSLHICFETKLASSLAVILAKDFPQPDSEKEQKTLDTCGPTLNNTSPQLDLFACSLRTSKDISPSDFEKSLATWKALVTQQRGEYSQRVKLALRTKENESTSWATPRAADSAGGPRTLNEKGQRISVSDPTKTYGANLSDQVRHWPTPSTRDHKGGYQGGRIRNGKVSFDTLDVAVQHFSGNKTKVGHLNPDWVEWLMGLPTGWTALEH